MSAFFESEIIKDALEDINKLQEDVYGKLVHFHMMTYDEQIDHVSKLTELLESSVSCILDYHYQMIQMQLL